jgi:hypothetical protein
LININSTILFLAFGSLSSDFSNQAIFKSIISITFWRLDLLNHTVFTNFIAVLYTAGLNKTRSLKVGFIDGDLMVLGDLALVVDLIIFLVALALSLVALALSLVAVFVFTACVLNLLMTDGA